MHSQLVQCDMNSHNIEKYKPKNKLLQLLIGCGLYYSVCFATLISIALSLLTTIPLLRLLNLQEQFFSRMTLSAVIPAIVAPPIAYFAIKLIFTLEETRASLHEMATRDALTKIHNRQYLFERADAAIEFSKREDLPLVLLLIDIDNFKEINDTYGHSAGDIYLKAFSEICLKHLRPYDILVRYGGDEFIAILTKTTLATAHEVIERLRISTKELTIRHEDACEIGTTISVGISQLSASNTNIQQLIDEADKYLYVEKKSRPHSSGC